MRNIENKKLYLVIFIIVKLKKKWYFNVKKKRTSCSIIGTYYKLKGIEGRRDCC